MSSKKASRDARLPIPDETVTSKAPAPYNMDISANGFSGTHWGPQLWTVLHMISFNYPCFPSTANRQHYFVFVHGLQFVLPCGVCRESLATELSRIKFSVGHRALDSRDALSRFIYKLHTSVTRHKRDTNPVQNTRIVVPITYEKLKEEIEAKRAGYIPLIKPDTR
jgi:hypothetical protein